MAWVENHLLTEVCPLSQADLGLWQGEAGCQGEAPGLLPWLTPNILMPLTPQQHLQLPIQNHCAN